PLETARARFRACSSSLANAPCETRCVRTERTPLHDTHPEPFPVARGGRTSKRCRRRRLLCLLRRLVELSRAARPEGSRPAFAWGDVAPPSRPIPGRHSLPPSSTRRRISPPYEVLTQRDDDRLTTFRRRATGRLGRVSPPGERHLRAASS